ncbi:hypothetical protein [Lactococcus allomyrinae]|uniref:Uncharacterized protein n=1 Tax=Lactococcus allomyrinae TaxID=2419773 RepID=A0A387BBT9_9LACT|nr:hypothetical protein [Lactococcus allomyrinae]AYG01315.1 hypothetical protein D7I46_09535 [Lactococcus allomyrinae]
MKNNKNDKLPSWIDINYQLQNNNYEIKKLGLMLTPPTQNRKIIKWVTNTLITLLFIAPITYQLSSIYSSGSSPISYDNISHFKSTGTIITPEGTIEGEVNHGISTHPVTNYNFSIAGELGLYSGEIKDVYIIYNENDDNSKLSPNNFHELKNKKNIGPSKTVFAQAFIPFKQIFDDHVIYHKTDFVLKNIHYHTTKTTLFYKPFYILTVDKKNNISIRLLLIKNKSGSGVTSLSSYANFIYSPESLQQAPEYKLFLLSDILKLTSPEKKYDISKENVEKSVNEIRTIANDFYI